jgi:hypothetical protein
MTRKRSPLHQWEQEILDAYYDYQWHLILDPLYEKFQERKTSKISHSEMDKAIHETHKSSQNLFNRRNQPFELGNVLHPHHQRKHGGSFQ